MNSDIHFDPAIFCGVLVGVASALLYRSWRLHHQQFQHELRHRFDILEARLALLLDDLVERRRSTHFDADPPAPDFDSSEIDLDDEPIHLTLAKPHDPFDMLSSEFGRAAYRLHHTGEVGPTSRE